MRKLSDYIGMDLSIIQRSIWKREMDFCSEESLIARLKYPKFFSDRAELSFGDDVYEFYRPGFFGRAVDVRKKGYQISFAGFKSNFWSNRGVLELPRGIKVNIKFGMLKKVAEIFEGENDLIVTIYNRFSFKERCRVIVEKRSAIIDEHPWIIMLAYYFAQLRRRNSAIGS